jgi:tetratricopeptide (TPR) repeat protein
VLRCNLGMALAKMGKPAEALAHMDEAITADPANPLARFERAGVLLAQERFVDALAELEALRVTPLILHLLPLNPPRLFSQDHALLCLAALSLAGKHLRTSWSYG